MTRTWGCDVSAWQLPETTTMRLDDAVSHGLGFVIIKASMGGGVDTMYLRHLEALQRYPGLIVGIYHWADPTAGIDQQVARFGLLADDPRVDFIVCDNEQWWSNWGAYHQAIANQIPWSAVPRYNNTTLDNFYRTTMARIRTRVPGKLLFNYTSSGFISTYSPAMSTWINQYPLWVASWPPYSDKVNDTWANFQQFMDTLDTPSMPVGANTWRIWQFANNNLILPGFTRGMDLNIYYSDYARMTSDITDGFPPPSPPPPPSLQWYRVIAAWLNVRSGPGVAYPIVSFRKFGDRVCEYGRSPDGWVKISPTVEQWVSGNWLAKI